MSRNKMTAIAQIQTTAEAVEYVLHLFATQLERSMEQKPEPNAAIDGDRAARTAFLTLLPPEEQRRLMMRMAGDRKFWPRIRPLIGAPPFTFLRPQGPARAKSVYPESKTTLSTILTC